MALEWETVIGLEVHAELSTKTKIFCGCRAAFGGEPNTNVCPVCSGMPGALPMLNRSVVEYAIRAGLALGCTIARRCKFDRKNYFYPDLPKSYQVSQLYSPICRDGQMEVEAGNIKKTVGIREIHMEEDAGKLTHGSAASDKTAGFARGSTSGTFMDFNRSCVPLLEIVSQPDFRSADEVLAYLEQLRETLLYLGICDCKMQEGSLRADVNLSVRKPGDEMGVRTEMKNLNSFKAVGRAIEYETERHIEILESGGMVVQETRRWDDEKGESYGMRSKENAPDYRYFPEPDLLPIEIDDPWLERIKQNLPELARQKRQRYSNDFGISEYEASVLTGHKKISDLFEDLAAQSGEPVESAHLITGIIMQLMNSTGTAPDELSIDGRKLSVLVSLVLGGKINRSAYKETAQAVFADNVEPEAYIAEKGLAMVSDNNAITEAVETVLSLHADAVSDYRSGKDKVFGFLMGEVMKKLGGTGNPAIARETLKELLGK